VYDVHHRRAPVVKRRGDGNGLSILMSDSELVDLERGSLTSRWPFGDDILSMADICKQLGTEASLASIEAASIEALVHRTLPEEARCCL
jgi:hypothetical protein